MVPYQPHHYHPEARLRGGMAHKPSPSLPTTEDDLAPPAYVESSLQTSFASVTLHKSDRIRLLQFPAEDIAAVRSIIKQDWRSGIQEERTFATAHEFKCHGNPWSGHGSDAIPARLLLRGILAHLFACGWILTAATAVSRTAVARDTMIFRKQAVAAPPPPPSEWLAISFNQGDRLRLIGAPADLVAAFQALLQGMGLWQAAGWKDRALDAWEFKLVGWPWTAGAGETVLPRMLLLRMLETLEACGWSLYATVDQNNGYSRNDHHGMGTDSWYCLRAADWVPGNNVFHR